MCEKWPSRLLSMTVFFDTIHHTKLERGIIVAVSISIQYFSLLAELLLIMFISADQVLTLYNSFNKVKRLRLLKRILQSLFAIYFIDTLSIWLLVSRHRKIDEVKKLLFTDVYVIAFFC